MSKFEFLRVHLRFFYCTFIWFIPKIHDPKSTTDVRLPLWIAAAIVWLFSQIERYCFNGTRAEVALFSLGFYIHLIVYSIWYDKEKVIYSINGVLCLYCVICYILWRRYKTADMSNLTLSGQYKVGFKRIKGEHGNTVLCFYPVSNKEIETTIPAYENPEKYIKGLKILK